jgi:G3E family GTPase
MSAVSLGKARYVMIGGFLGAGKTSAIARFGDWLRQKNLRVGLITNDQGSELVDTKMLRAHGFETEEIQGGCFCCRFNSLMEASQRLTESSKPDVFVAEPVGSCTDLVATVTYPLRRLYGANFTIAPLSVMVDPIRARRVFNLETGGNFSDKVRYIYRKQLEEADIIVLNKSDMIAGPALRQLRETLGQEFKKATFVEVSARTGEGTEEWFNRLICENQTQTTAMDVDYRIYGEGEALLGWLNCTVRFSSPREFDGNAIVRVLAEDIRAALQASDTEVAHLKMTLSAEHGLGDLAVINLVRNDFVPELSQELELPIESGQLILNLRAEGSPEILHRAVTDALNLTSEKNPTLFARLEHLEHFRPGKPLPTHRFANMS